MRFRIFRRRAFSVNNRRMAIRQHWPWPARMLLLFLVLVCATAVLLCVYERQRSQIGVEAQLREQLKNLENEVKSLQTQQKRTKTVVLPLASAVENGGEAQALTLANQTTIDLLSQQNRALQEQNQSLKDDLGFFEYLLPVDDSGAVAIRSIQASKSADAANAALEWQLLVMQLSKGSSAFKGQLQLHLKGQRAGQDWELVWPEQGQKQLEFDRFLRVEGRISVPEDVELATLTARILVGRKVLSSQTVALPSSS